MQITFNYKIDLKPQQTLWLLNLQLTCELSKNDFDIEAFDVLSLDYRTDGQVMFDDAGLITSESTCLITKSHLREEIREDLERYKNDIYLEAVKAYEKQRSA